MTTVTGFEHDTLLLSFTRNADLLFKAIEVLNDKKTS